MRVQLGPVFSVNRKCPDYRLPVNVVVSSPADRIFLNVQLFLACRMLYVKFVIVQDFLFEDLS